MHELSIAASIVDLAQEEAEKRGVRAVDLRSRGGQLLLRAKPERAGDHLPDLADFPEKEIFLR